MAMVPRDVAINRPVFELTPKSQPKYPHAQMEPAVERVSATDAAYLPPSRRYAIRHGIRCVSEFTNCTPSRPCMWSVDVTGAMPSG